MVDDTVTKQIIEAIEEARILECAMEEYSKDRMLTTAQRLSGTDMTTEEINAFISKIYSNRG
jgi:hypothetical protein